MEWKTGRGLGLVAGSGLVAGLLLFDGFLIWNLERLPISLWTFVMGLLLLLSLLPLGLLLYWLYSLAQSVYFLDRNVLAIRWGPAEQLIPTGQIERVLLGSQVEGRVRFWGGRWPGHWVGFGEVAGVGPAIFYATAPVKEQILIVTPGVAYGISPADPQGFLEALHARLEMGPTRVVEQVSRHPTFLRWHFWRDRLGQGLLGGAVVFNLSLFAITSWLFPFLPRLLPMHFDAAGQVDRFGPKGQLFILPFIGFLVLLVNGGLGVLLYRREQVATYLLWGAAILVQILAWAATLGILQQL